ncbi:hypothetical protein Patl1_18455 [Pistacia atlantica]|uniref:Uncharacterized protein n=1 Tax=Pistacia atlantica TaxID=434234 RepID=A0ACC1C264_9ROSI|nr:hypothetical protein Patl1_18455 [Pistacia atlantica]
MRRIVLHETACFQIHVLCRSLIFCCACLWEC